MADTSGLPNLDGLVDKLIENFYEPQKLARLQNAIRNANAEAEVVADAAKHKAKTDAAEAGESYAEQIEAFGGGVAAWFLSKVVANTFDVEVDSAAFTALGQQGRRRALARKVAEKMVEALTGGNTSINASPQPAANYLAVVFSQVFESWSIGEVIEIITAFFPAVEKIEHVAELGDKLVNALGFTDSSARVLRPYIDTYVVEPLRRHIAKTATPNLLSESLAVRQYLRGEWQREELDAEMALLGWDSKRVEAHINNGEKFLSFDDAIQLARGGGWDIPKVVDNLKQQGYREATAFLMVEADRRKRLNSVSARALSPLIDAFVDGNLTEGDLRNELIGIFEEPTERERAFNVADKLRKLRRRRLTHGEVLDMVELGILPRFYYRRWLAEEGYPEFEAAALELRLSLRMKKDAEVEAERARIAAERAADKAARDAAAAAKRAEVEERRRLQRRGSPADLERAVIRGLIPLSRLEEVLAPDVDSDTLTIMLALVEEDRARYVEQQRAAEEAKTRGAVRRLDVAAIEAAVFAGALTVDEYGARLAQLGFSPDDARLLVATLRDRLADRRDAEAKRLEAERRAQRRTIDLGRFETLVRRGVRTLAQYRALLTSLGFDEGAIAAMAELLELKIADDAAATAARDEAAARLAARGISLDQMRRAVILGLRGERDVEALLVAQGFTSEAQALILEELRLDVSAAEDARRRRAEAEARGGAPALSLSRLARAVRLGVVDADTYAARLAAAGYSADDAGIELELLAVEVAEERAGQARRVELDRDSAARGLSLAELARAVKLGVAPLDDYRARAATLGYSVDDVQTLVALLARELATLDDARARRQAINAEGGDRALSLGQLEEALKKGLRSPDEYIAGARALGYGADDAELLAMLALTEAGAAPPEG
jgi:hypothetical protein